MAFAVVAIMVWSQATSVRMARRYGHIGASAQREAMQRLDAPQPPAQESPTADKSVH